MVLVGDEAIYMWLEHCLSPTLETKKGQCGWQCHCSKAWAIAMYSVRLSAGLKDTRSITESCMVCGLAIMTAMTDDGCRCREAKGCSVAGLDGVASADSETGCSRRPPKKVVFVARGLALVSAIWSVREGECPSRFPERSVAGDCRMCQVTRRSFICSPHVQLLLHRSTNSHAPQNKLARTAKSTPTLRNHGAHPHADCFAAWRV